MAAADFFTSHMATAASQFKSEFEADSMDSFFDFNQAESYSSPNINKLQGRIEAPTPRSASTVSNTTALALSDDPAEFTGPSHDYGRYQQQIGVPSGTVANFDLLNRPVLGLCDDESSSLEVQQNWSTGFDDTDMIDESACTYDGNYLTPPNSQPSLQSFSSTIEPETSQVRIYPGMHSNAAARVDHRTQNGAVARAPQPLNIQHKREDQYSQHTQYQNQPSVPFQLMGNGFNVQIAPQAPLQITPAQIYTSMPQQVQTQNLQSQSQRRLSQIPQQPTQAIQPSPSRSRGSSTHNDEFTQQTIKNVLQKIREDSQVAAQNADDDGLPHLAKLKKDEEDMDDDERLLASDEGKKLSSKERRQLRNKVSARAFRSRRKDYIHTLESTIKESTEELKVKQAENNQLVNLVNMLLAQPGMRGTLETLSRDQAFLQQATQHQRNSMASSQGMQLQLPTSATTPTVANLSPYTSTSPSVTSQTPRQSAGSDLDMGGLNIDAQWPAAGETAFDFNQPNIFAVFEVPEGPMIPELNVSSLSGKSSESDLLFKNNDAEDAKADLPVIDRVPEIKASLPVSEERESAQQESETVDEEVVNDPLFALFVNSPFPPTQTIRATPAVNKINLVITSASNQRAEDEMAAMVKNMNASLRRIENLI